MPKGSQAALSLGVVDCIFTTAAMVTTKSLRISALAAYWTKAETGVQFPPGGGAAGWLSSHVSKGAHAHRIQGCGHPPPGIANPLPDTIACDLKATPLCRRRLQSITGLKANSALFTRVVHLNPDGKSISAIFRRRGLYFHDRSNGDHKVAADIGACSILDESRNRRSVYARRRCSGVAFKSRQQRGPCPSDSRVRAPSPWNCQPLAGHHCV